MADEELLRQLSSLNHAKRDNRARQQLVYELRKAAARLETPFELMQRPFTLIALRSAQGLGILKRLVEAREKNTSIRVDNLASDAGLPPGLISALLDKLVSDDVAEEVGPDQYVGTPGTSKYDNEAAEAAFAVMSDGGIAAWSGIYKSFSDDQQRTGWEIGMKTSSSPYQWFQEPENAQEAATFHRYMQTQFRDIPSWLHGIDFAERYAKDLQSNEVVLVDVGGGNGQGLEKLRKEVPNLRGKLIHQDRQDQLARAPAIAGVEKMPYDYFTEQPVKGARIYYFRQIFHNHDDDSCVSILRNQRGAMSNKSVLLIDEKVLQDDEVFSKYYTSALSLNMYALFKGMERKQRHWGKLIEAAGLQIKSIRVYTDFQDAIITVSPRDTALATARVPDIYDGSEDEDYEDDDEDDGYQHEGHGENVGWSGSHHGEYDY